MSTRPFQRRLGTLDRSSGVPLRLQLRDALQRQITEGSYHPGEAFPTEREIAERFRVSRTTIREALVDLVKDGFLVRQQGKGTFVARAKDAFDATRLSSFSEDMRKQGLAAGSRLLDVRDDVPSGEIAAHFGADVKRVRGIHRLRFANDEPIALQLSWLPLPRFDFPPESIADGSLYALLEERHGVYIDSADEVISAQTADAEEARLLGIEPDAPLLCVLRFAYSQTGEAIECVRIRYRADRYTFSVHQRRGG